MKRFFISKDSIEFLSPIKKAQTILDYLSSGGKLTDAQCEKFVEYALMPQPPFIPDSILDFPRYWYNYWKFLWANKRWEEMYKKENPLKNRVFKIVPSERYKITTVGWKK
ncbi:MAG: hypothetical protein KAS32_19540 [Candidatus Peribacteraceae bacterium]|nr:hypothetical protein [Candidatus Peribacteraceae bacterium]